MYENCEQDRIRGGPPESLLKGGGFAERNAILRQVILWTQNIDLLLLVTYYL